MEAKNILDPKGDMTTGWHPPGYGAIDNEILVFKPSTPKTVDLERVVTAIAKLWWVFREIEELDEWAAHLDEEGYGEIAAALRSLSIEEITDG